MLVLSCKMALIAHSISKSRSVKLDEYIRDYPFTKASDCLCMAHCRIRDGPTDKTLLSTQETQNFLASQETRHLQTSERLWDVFGRCEHIAPNEPTDGKTNHIRITSPMRITSNSLSPDSIFFFFIISSFLF